VSPAPLTTAPAPDRSGPADGIYHLPHVTENARTGAGAAAYRGFLFSDLRGFTAFAERHGNTAAAAKVGRFLEITRRAISRHEGAEIKTEGDAIHAVFPSASSAVLCGLEIVDAAAELNAQEPDRPLGLGVGVHAGEAVETAEGYIGRAVNIASRLCAAAKPGEVLVSSTVKGITQSSIPVGFIPRGRRRLKGIQDPIVVYAVTRDQAARGTREMPRPMVLGAAGIAAAAVVAIAVLGGSLLSPGPAASQSAPPASSAPAEATAQPVGIGSLDIGTYATQQFQPPLTFRVVDKDWSANRDVERIFGLVRDSPPGSLNLLRVSSVITDPCAREGKPSAKGPRALTLLTQLEAIRHLMVSERLPVEVGGIPARQVDVTVRTEAQAACGGLAGGDVAIFDAGEEVWSATSGETFRVISVGVGDQAVAIVLSWSETQSVQDLVESMEITQRLIDSMEF
jgi:class 3 adenylate cyclase